MNLPWEVLHCKKNTIKAPGASGTTFDMVHFQQIDDPTTTANAQLKWFITDRSELRFTFWPFESRDNGEFSQPVDFAGANFPANTSIRSAWRHYDLRTTYVYKPKSMTNWHYAVGTSLSSQFTEIYLKTTDNTISAKVDNAVFLPLLHASMGYHFSSRMVVSAIVNGTSVSDDSVLDAHLTFRYRYESILECWLWC